MEIRRYCATHPNAADTLEGIAWWLAQQRYGEALDALRAAVDGLVAEGVLTRYEDGGGVCLFRCCPLPDPAGPAPQKAGPPPQKVSSR